MREKKDKIGKFKHYEISSEQSLNANSVKDMNSMDNSSHGIPDPNDNDSLIVSQEIEPKADNEGSS